MEKKNIGIFDSGFGGISVLNCCLHYMPKENYIYFADSQNAPFGTKNRDELFNIGKNIISKILPFNPSAIVIACGTMSTNILMELQDEFPDIKLIGTFPNFENIFTKGFVASEQSLAFSKEIGIKIKRKTKKILIIATSATCKSDYVTNLRDGYSDFIDVYIEPADFIVKAVEKNATRSFALKNELSDLFKEYKDIDYLVLGCTHFPFAETSIREVLGDKVKIISGCENAAINCKNYLYNNSNDDTKDNEEIDTTDKTFNQSSIKIIDTTLTDDRIDTYNSLLNIDKARYDITFSKE